MYINFILTYLIRYDKIKFISKTYYSLLINFYNYCLLKITNRKTFESIFNVLEKLLIYLGILEKFN